MLRWPFLFEVLTLIIIVVKFGETALGIWRIHYVYLSPHACVRFCSILSVGTLCRHGQSEYIFYHFQMLNIIYIIIRIHIIIMRYYTFQYLRLQPIREEYFNEFSALIDCNRELYQCRLLDMKWIISKSGVLGQFDIKILAGWPIH